MFRPTCIYAGSPWQYLKVEEGWFHGRRFERTRILNGDQTDWGLSFNTLGVLWVSLYTR